MSKELNKIEKEVKALEKELEDKKVKIEKLRNKYTSIEVIKKSEHILKTLKPVFEPLIKDWEKYHKLEGDYNVQEDYESFMDTNKLGYEQYYNQMQRVECYNSELRSFGKNIAHYIFLKKELKKLKKETGL